MKIYNISPKKIIPYDRNAKKHDDRQISNVMESIRQFGFAQPLVVDKDNVLIIGHCRLKAAERLNLKTVPVVRMDDLTPEEVDKLRLLDNKLNESPWDFDILIEDIPEIDWDGFDLDWELQEIPEIELEDIDRSYYGDERERTYEAYNLNDHDPSKVTGKYDMPILNPCNLIPDDLLGFNYMLSSKKTDTGIHFYVDDYQFERMWTNPYKYTERMKEFQCILTPDFSLYMDMPVATKIWNTYRNRLVGQICQNEGLNVIPTVSWAEKESYEYCFDGLPKNATLSVSTIGVKEDNKALQIWKEGMDEMIARLSPKTILVYGGKVEYDYGKAKVIYYKNHVTEEW